MADSRTGVRNVQEDTGSSYLTKGNEKKSLLVMSEGLMACLKRLPSHRVLDNGLKDISSVKSTEDVAIAALLKDVVTVSSEGWKGTSSVF